MKKVGKVRRETMTGKKMESRGCFVWFPPRHIFLSGLQVGFHFGRVGCCVVGPTPLRPASAPGTARSPPPSTASTGWWSTATTAPSRTRAGGTLGCLPCVGGALCMFAFVCGDMCIVKLPQGCGFGPVTPIYNDGPFFELVENPRVLFLLVATEYFFSALVEYDIFSSSILSLSQFFSSSKSPPCCSLFDLNPTRGF